MRSFTCRFIDEEGAKIAVIFKNLNLLRCFALTL